VLTPVIGTSLDGFMARAKGMRG